jgi:D-alanyl-D-alanine carboxypeptidase
MPFAMQFSGNFFIHGWPTHTDGTPVATTYSGGCIRMQDEDAKKVYNVARIGMPILIYERGFKRDTTTFSKKSASIASRSHMLADIESGFVFSSSHIDTEVPIASLTKLVTALVTVEHINLDTFITVPAAAQVYTSKARLTPGMQVRAYDLLLLLMRESSNEAAETLASFIGREKFIAEMNKKARGVGLARTVFTDPSGADAGNVSTSRDVYELVRHIYVNRKFILDLTAGRITNSAYGESAFPDVGNVNDFIDEPNFVGGKNGQTTAAKETGVSVFEVDFNGKKRLVTTIVLGSADGKKDQAALKAFLATFEQSGK